MLTKGEYRNSEGNYGVICYNTKEESELILVLKGNVWSSYKACEQGEFSYGNKKAKELWTFIKKAMKGCTAKNGTAAPFQLGTVSRHRFTKTNTDYIIDKFNGELAGAEIVGQDELYIQLEYYADEHIRPLNIPYIKLTVAQEFANSLSDSEEENIPVRTLEEISLEKDITWLKNKKYYVVNDDATAEKIFTMLDNWKDAIAYDTETTGLRINMFGKINSKWKKQLEEYNKGKPVDEQIRADRLVGIIFCVEPDTSYYFPCFNRKFKNLYEDRNSLVRKQTIQNIKARYTVGELRNAQTDMSRYFRDTPEEEIEPDCILMERCRNILETKDLVAHNGAFEWKVSHLYDISISLKDDTMILHQLMYKFRSTTANRGEPSSLKYLTKREFGIDQLDLGDFFVDFKEDSTGEVRAGSKRKKKSSKIDFSYMDYNGTVAYAPADGDTTLALFFKYKRDLVDNHKEMEYIYSVEIVVACAIGYMEFYGHRLDEEKVNRVRDSNRRRMIEIEHEIRVLAKASDEEETQAFNTLSEIEQEIKVLDTRIAEKKKVLEDTSDNEIEQLKSDRQELFIRRDEQIKLCREAIDNSSDVINLASPAQVAKLLFERLEYPFSGEKMSVAKKEIKPLLKMKDEDGNDKYPVVHLYSEWKKLDTLLTKFFDNLQYFMYPGGFIFSSYGQISTATGRMSCSKPNAQQYPKDVTGIVIPRDNYVLFDADYSQIEYRTLVAMANEPFLAELFKDPDNDYHTLMASLMYGVPYASVTPKMRSDAKSFNFGIPYGMGFKSLAILLTGMSGPSQVEEAKEKYELYFKDQPNVRKFFDQVKEMALVNKYTRTYWNRYRYYSFTDKDGNISNARKASALRQAGNAVIQGCLHGDTRIQTKDFGIVKIKDMVGRSLLVWDGDKWSNGDILYSGKKRQCIVTFSTGQKFICSPTHKFLVKSSKGNERFVECKDLRGSNISTNPHRVVINRRYEASDWKYSSNWAYKYKSLSNNSNNVFVDDVGDSFKAGVVLGRLASDGSILSRDIGGSCILKYVAEHELSIVPKLKEYMKNLNYKYADNQVREERNEKINRLYVYSQSLTYEVNQLDIKHKIHDNIFMDTELLRGFLRGFFDGNGGISGKTITLTFGTQANFEPMCKDIQKALLFFGIRSRYYNYGYRSKITIKTNDNQKFLDLIGFINEDKQSAGRELSCVRDEHLFGPTLVVESVEITDEYIDMYDVCNTDGGYYIADGIITHNTAADIFKISVARNFTWIKKKGLLGRVLIINMVHDEQLMEIDCDTVNTQKALRDIVDNMEFKVAGFPPLYIGAGFGPNWKEAKGKMAEIHPHLAEQMCRESDQAGMKIDSDYSASRKDVLDYYDKRVYEFRLNKVKDYVTNPDNFGRDLHPAIGNLINLQFTYGLEKTLDGDELTLAALAKFIEVNNIDVNPNNFRSMVEQVKEIEEDTEYDDSENEDGEAPEELEVIDNDFALIDEDDKLFGVSLQDLIKEFGLIVSRERRVCGIDVRIMPYKKKDEMVEYLNEHVAEPDEEGAMQIIFLQESNVLFNTGVWVKNIDGSAMSTKLKLNSLAY